MAKEPEPFEIVSETATNQPCTVRPDDIYIEIGGLLSTFGSAEVEQEAKRLVQFFQQKRYWFGFRLEELTLYYRENGWDPEEALAGLAKPWHHDWDGWIPASKPYVVQDEHGVYYITNLFIDRCMEAADPTAFIAMIEGVVQKITELDELPQKKNTFH